MQPLNDALVRVLDRAVAFVREQPGFSLLVLAGLQLLLLALTLWTLVRYNRLARKQARLLRGADGSNLERMLLDHLDHTAAVRQEIDRAAARGQSNETALRSCLQRTGVVRYDAFPDVGGQQSFSAALLDADGNGVVISGLHSRHDMRIYAKPVAAGQSASPNAALSDEEREAIRAARPGAPAESVTTTPTNGRAAAPSRR